MKNKIIVYTLITVMFVNQFPMYGSRSSTAWREAAVGNVTTLENEIVSAEAEIPAVAESSASESTTEETPQGDAETTGTTTAEGENSADAGNTSEGNSAVPETPMTVFTYGESTPVTSTGEVVYEDKTVNESWTLTEDTTVGNLTICSYASVKLNGHMLTVMGDCDMPNGYLYMQGGELRCMGDMTMSAHSYLYTENVNDYLYIEGNFTWWGGKPLSVGTMEVKGDFTSTAAFQASGTHKIIFSGTGKQCVTLSDGGFFNEVELRNYSSEGVEIEYSFRYNTLKQNGCVLTYAEIDGERGHVLEEDETYDGLYYLITDTLDLNGHTMTINGDLVQGGGTININGGTLIINGSYMVETMTQDENGEITYGDSAGVLIMQNNEDYVYVGGNYINHGTYEDNGNLTDGVLEIIGDVEISDQKGLVFRHRETIRSCCRVWRNRRYSLHSRQAVRKVKIRRTLQISH